MVCEDNDYGRDEPERQCFGHPFHLDYQSIVPAELPEPLDDVYCLGGTIHRLNTHGNEVTIAYQTSGDLAVPDPEARQAIEMIIDVAEARGHVDEEKYGRQLENELNEKGEATTLITLHQAKGLEFPVVFIVGMEEGLLPHRRSLDNPEELEEERRLCYVGVTRAQFHLTITHAKSRARYGQRVESMPSRFLFEIRDELPPKGWRATGQIPAPSARGGGKPKRSKASRL